ncbi:MAG: acyloxyacyl hydrolase [Ancalomicrobiaceae bacterium]|nr:acyloxyacyl hydrolase [Ancalomicrobiaceae bacterium]
MTLRNWFPLLFAAALALPFAAPALGVDSGDQIAAAFRLLDEVRIGAYSHNPHDHVTWYQREISGLDLSGEVLSSKVWTGTTGNVFLDAFLSPRLHAGVMASTNNHNSYVFAGLTWRYGLFDKLYVESEFGGAVNNGPTHWDAKRTDLGCPVTFRESAGIGYQFTTNWSLTANVEHISHADLCPTTNPGQTNWGARIGYKF